MNLELRRMMMSARDSDNLTRLLHYCCCEWLVCHGMCSTRSYVIAPSYQQRGSQAELGKTHAQKMRPMFHGSVVQLYRTCNNSISKHVWMKDGIVVLSNSSFVSSSATVKCPPARSLYLGYSKKYRSSRHIVLSHRVLLDSKR